MSFTRGTVWTCDFCFAIVSKDGYGLPEGWFWIMGHPLKHACAQCEKQFNERQKGRSGSVKIVADEGK